MLLVVNAPKAFQRKLVDGVDRSTTRPAKTDSRLGSLPLPAPGEQTQCAEADQHHPRCAFHTGLKYCALSKMKHLTFSFKLLPQSND